MADISTTLPSVDDAIAFKNLVDAARIKRNALRPGFILDYDEAIREEVLNHDFFKSVSRQRKFQKAIGKLKDKGLEGDFPPRLEIEIAYCLALLLPEYDFFAPNPDKIKVTTGEVAGKASGHVGALLKLLKSDIQMERFGDYFELCRLLEKLKRELSGEDATTYLKNRKGKVLGRRLVASLYPQIVNLLGEAPVVVLSELVSIMQPVSEQITRRCMEELSTKSLKSRFADDFSTKP